MTELTQEAKALLGALDKKHLENIEAIQRVRELHYQSGEVQFIGKSMPICQGCKTFWPCDTIKALDGEQ